MDGFGFLNPGTALFPILLNRSRGAEDSTHAKTKRCESVSRDKKKKQQLEKKKCAWVELLFSRKL